eukprot:11178888-Lingulodinium_polyedra.AAC.1
MPGPPPNADSGARASVNWSVLGRGGLSPRPLRQQARALLTPMFVVARRKRHRDLRGKAAPSPGPLHI